MLTRGCCIYSDTRVWGGIITGDSEGKAFQPEGTAKVKATGGNEHGVLKSGDERMMSLEETRSRVWGSQGAHCNGLVALRKGLACILGTLGITHNISRREWTDLNYTVRSYTSSCTMPLYLSSPAQAFFSLKLPLALSARLEQSTLCSLSSWLKTPFNQWWICLCFSSLDSKILAGRCLIFLFILSQGHLWYS